MLRLFSLLLLSVSCFGQDLPALQFSESAPADLLATRSAVLYSSDVSLTELTEFQQGFQQIGIDAVVYFEMEKVFSGKDPARMYADYLNTRQIKYLVLLQKQNSEYQFVATLFNGKPAFVEPSQAAWRVKGMKIYDMLQQIYRDSWLVQKKQNYLINDIPEMPGGLNMITGRRAEFFALDLKVDNLAVPKTGDEAIDRELEQLFAAHYPYKYKLVEATYDEKELRKLGFHYVLTYVKTSGRASRELLGYDMTKTESAYASVTWPNGSSQVKTIAADKPVYKFYFKHIESGNVFLGTRWDADETYMQALKNHLMGFRAELRLN